MTEELRILKTAPFICGIGVYRCDWKPTCTIVASNDLFGNPCKTTYKYIEVLCYCVGKDGMLSKNWHEFRMYQTDLFYWVLSLCNIDSDLYKGANQLI
jgi:hypothetical protein